ncbi:hypothetical protein FQN55_002041 [Onygenales sp. PD_40]|nr:hypothetical protein FQN55_002041 [Onygenales sp. PD_40]KAK2779470.1 hypothetical protein FQN53_001366 [Emmonsiellopsis sp. PD_33]KAK2792282.1 hypothetical protein FQN52_003759 [Onygenales sp. PD_12]KAK2800601.1 hypothetical protein FQN51_005984 [Onygenales sp. PD_10]
MPADPSFTRFHLPGLSLPLDFVPRPGKKTRPAGEGREMLPSPLNDTDIDFFEDGKFRLPLTTRRELRMMRIMNQITEKPDWENKVFNEEITNTWILELIDKQDPLTGHSNPFSSKMADFVIDELQYRAERFCQTGWINPYHGDVVHSDSFVSNEVKHALRTAVSALENIPEPQKDWHPRSENLVLDLVHPSLFPLIYGRTRVLRGTLVSLDDCLEQCGEGGVIPVPKASGYHRLSYSTKFQWLPCDVELISPSVKAPSDETGGDSFVQGPRCKITSYINNLHPNDHKELYSVIEDVMACCIPLWNATLSRLSSLDNIPLRIKYTKLELSARGLAVQPEPVNFQDWLSEKKKSDTVQKIDLTRDYGERGLQVIVKLANIHLTPEKPKYDGGSWHVEGQLNEHICSTALYYYDSENITESRLSFRQHASINVNHIEYDQQTNGWLGPIFGVANNQPSLQEVGSVICKEDRLITFPNILQHRVSPFQLQDPTKPGHRKILALFLVDPNIRVISTANVPPQRHDWWSRQILDSTRALSSLPRELQDEVLDEVKISEGSYPISLDEAKALRLELMDERKEHKQKYDKNSEVFMSIDLCEH